MDPAVLWFFCMAKIIFSDIYKRSLSKMLVKAIFC